MSVIVGKQNSAEVKSEASGLHPTKIDEDEIAPQEICKDDCDSAESDNNMYFGGMIIVSVLLLFSLIFFFFSLIFQFPRPIHLERTCSR